MPVEPDPDHVFFENQPHAGPGPVILDAQFFDVQFPGSLYQVYGDLGPLLNDCIALEGSLFPPFPGDPPVLEGDGRFQPQIGRDLEHVPKVLDDLITCRALDVDFHPVKPLKII